VAYAHSRGIVHRDLKPANVLLGPYGETLLVDWGLAKPLAVAEGKTAPPEGFLRPAAQEVATQAGAVVGTPAYMAPEQAAGNPAGRAADVYGLGATLYHLLAGRPPFGGLDVLDVLMRVVQGQCRPAREVNPAVPAALSAVCHKAMAPEPQGRYDSAKELAAEVERWLADEPVIACRERWPTRLARWGRRHRPLVASSAVLLLSAVAALAVGVAAVNAEKKRTAQALRQTRAALDEMSSQVIEDWLARRGPLEPAQRAFLEKALAYYEAFAAESGQTEEVRRSVADAYLRVGRIHRRLERYADAEATGRRAAELFAGLVADFPGVLEYRRSLANSHNSLGTLLMDTGRPQEAEAAFRAAGDITKKLTADLPAVAEYRQELAGHHSNLGVLLLGTGRLKEAEAAYRDARDVRQQLAAEFPAVAAYRKDLAISHNNLANLLELTGRPKEAETAYRDALAIQQRLVAEFASEPEYRRDLAMTHNNLGILLADTGRPKEAEAAYNDAVGLQKRLAAEFPAIAKYRHELARSYVNLANLLASTSRPKEAEAAYHDALDVQKRLASEYPSAPEYWRELAAGHNNLGTLLDETGRPKEAEAAFRESLEIKKRLAAEFPTVPQYRLDLASGHNNLGILLKDTGRPQEAEAACRAALEIEKQLASEFPAVPEYRLNLAASHGNLGRLLANTGRLKEAEAAYRDARDIYEPLVAEFPTTSEYPCELAAVLDGLAELAHGRKEYAAARRLLEQARPHAQAALDANPQSPRYREVLRGNRQQLAAALLELGEHAAAAEVAVELARISGDPANDDYTAASFFCRCVVLAEKDTKLPQVRRQELAKSYGDQAMAALKQAVAKGYKDTANLHKDKELDPLRSRTDFKDLLAGLGPKAK
jgi:serine/threonine-protein kinase